MLRASAEAEKTGIRTVNIVGSGFMKQAAFVSKPRYPVRACRVSRSTDGDSDEDVRAKVRGLLPAIVEGLTSGARPSFSGDVEPSPAHGVQRRTPGSPGTFP